MKKSDIALMSSIIASVVTLGLIVLFVLVNR